jgi:prepilin-type N-terminal cleavage/methylation domain-containing protein
MQQRSEARDDGFTLIEVIVAMSVFTVLVTMTLGIMVRTTDVARSNTRRVAADNLANRQIESARSALAINIPDGAQTRSEVVGGTTYTVDQVAKYVASDSVGSVCTGTGNELAYKLVTVSVTWPQMGSAKPVRADTLKSVGLGDEGLDDSTGTLAVGVNGSAGNNLAGITVTLDNGRSMVTGSDGCAVFTGLAPTTYTATVNATGYVGSANTQQVSVGSLGVIAGQVQRGTILYDTSRTVNVALNTPAGFPVPSTLPLSLRSTYLSDRAYPRCSSAPANSGCVTAVPGTLRYLFPTTYDVYTGTCADSKVPVTVNLTPASSSGSSITARAGSVHVNVRNSSGTALAGRVVTARHANESVPTGGVGCAGGETYTLNPTTTSGVDSVLPLGTWTLSVPATSGPPITRTVTLTASGGTVSRNLDGAA